jgi:transcriptional regulator with XRE-family HTH domain
MGEEEPEEKLDDLAARTAMHLLRYAKDMDQADLARAARISSGQASNYEQAKHPVPRQVLERVAAATSFPVSLLDFLLRGLRSFLLASRGRSLPDRSLAEWHALERLALARETADLVLEPRIRLRPPSAVRPRAEDRTELAPLVTVFQESTPAQARLLVEEALEYRSWVLCEAAALASIRQAANHPQVAREWALLAIRIAELVPGEEDWRWRLQGWALHFLANAERVCNDLPAAEKARVRGRALWEASAPADTGLLNEAWLPGLEANLRMDQRQFSEALQKIDEALALAPRKMRAEVLLSKSNILRRLDNPEGSSAALLETEALIDARQQPRLAFGVRFNLLMDLCALGRAAEGAPRLPEVWALAERLGEALDLTRCLWLEGQIAAGLGRLDEATAAFRQVRRVFLEHPLPYDYALASLDLSLVLLEEGRTTEVRTLAEEMLSVFKAQQVHREALAALRLFCEAAKQEVATVALARRVERFLRRAQVDPGLRFEEAGSSD